jgi:hypothetical protein
VLVIYQQLDEVSVRCGIDGFDRMGCDQRLGSAGSPRGICRDVSNWAVHAANNPTSPVNHLAGQQTCLPRTCLRLRLSVQRRRRTLTTRVLRWTLQAPES